MREPPAGPIPVSRPSLPPLKEVIPLLEQIWESRQLTNCGPLHQELERRLAVHLDVPFLSLFNNGTNALITALQSMELRGEVVTTPYSFAATAHSILWNGLTPVFADIDPSSFALDPERVEEAITADTTAILAVHCYGYPCDVDRLRDLAKRYDLRLVYDAAHCFGVRLHGNSLLNHGDLAVLSFHATKVFNTFEGGAIVCHDSGTKAKIDRLRNFGISDEDTIDLVGSNGKLNELQAAIGLKQLPHIDAAISRRLTIARRYRDALADVAGLRVPVPGDGVELNGSYFPILVGEGYPIGRDELHARLRSRGVFARRYFYPLLSNLKPYVKLASSAEARLPIANAVANSVLCLPIYESLADSEIDYVVDCIVRH